MPTNISLHNDRTSGGPSEGDLGEYSPGLLNGPGGPEFVGLCRRDNIELAIVTRDNAGTAVLVLGSDKIIGVSRVLGIDDYRIGTTRGSGMGRRKRDGPIELGLGRVEARGGAVYRVGCDGSHGMGFRGVWVRGWSAWFLGDDCGSY